MTFCELILIIYAALFKKTSSLQKTCQIYTFKKKIKNMKKTRLKKKEKSLKIKISFMKGFKGKHQFPVEELGL